RSRAARSRPTPGRPRAPRTRPRGRPSAACWRRSVRTGRAATGSELDGHGPARGVVGLEVLVGGEPEHAGEDARREDLDLRVQLEHFVVVELAGVGDAP